MEALKTRGPAALILVALAMLTACASKIPVRIDAERSPTANFYVYQTYDWLTPLSPEEARERPHGGRALLNWRIRSEVARQLSARGLEKVSSGRPDLLVDYRVEIREKNTESFGDYMAYRNSGGQEWLTEAFVFGYQEGAVTIEVDEAATQKMVWRASATGLVDPETQGELVTDTVRRMFERFP
jgi:hypothetical protein